MGEGFYLSYEVLLLPIAIHCKFAPHWVRIMAHTKSSNIVLLYNPAAELFLCEASYVLAGPFLLPVLHSLALLLMFAALSQTSNKSQVSISLLWTWDPVAATGSMRKALSTINEVFHHVKLQWEQNRSAISKAQWIEYITTKRPDRTWRRTRFGHWSGPWCSARARSSTEGVAITQRNLRLRIISLLVIIVSAVGFCGEAIHGRRPRTRRYSPIRNLPSTKPLMIFGLTAIMAGLLQIIGIIFYLTGPWSRSRNIRGMPKVLVAYDRSILEAANPSDMELVNRQSFAELLSPLKLLNPLVCDIIVTGTLISSLAAVNHLPEARGYVRWNIFGIYNRTLAMWVMPW